MIRRKREQYEACSLRTYFAEKYAFEESAQFGLFCKVYGIVGTTEKSRLLCQYLAVSQSYPCLEANRYSSLIQKRASKLGYEFPSLVIAVIITAF